MIDHGHLSGDNAMRKSWSEHRSEVGIQRMRNMLQEHTGRVATKEEIERLIEESGIPYVQGGPGSPRGTRRLWSLPDAHKVLAMAMVGGKKHRPPPPPPVEKAPDISTGVKTGGITTSCVFFTGQADEILEHLFQSLEDGKRYRVGVFEV